MLEQISGLPVNLCLWAWSRSAIDRSWLADRQQRTLRSALPILENDFSEGNNWQLCYKMAIFFEDVPFGLISNPFPIVWKSELNLRSWKIGSRRFYTLIHDTGTEIEYDTTEKRSDSKRRNWKYERSNFNFKIR